MDNFQYIRTVLTRPASLKPQKNIFMLSHMRANTSLFGHILGSNPEISGYYEMHIGYYSWKSLVRQKLLYYRDHQIKSQGRFIFDKVLHDFHYVDMSLLARVKARVIIVLREPEQTIKSIVSQFSRERPGHEYCEVSNAVDYYCQRVESLLHMAQQCEEFFYFDADELKTNTGQLLNEVTNWLELKHPLSPEFENFHFSGKLDTGDLSGKLALGKVEKKRSDYSQIHLPDLLRDRASEVYVTASQALAGLPQNRSKKV